MEQFRKFLIAHGMLEKYIRAINDPNCSSMGDTKGIEWRYIIENMLKWYPNHGDSTEKDWDKLRATWYGVAPQGYIDIPRELFLLGLQSKKSILHNCVKFCK